MCSPHHTRFYTTRSGACGYVVAGAQPQLHRVWAFRGGTDDQRAHHDTAAAAGQGMHSMDFPQPVVVNSLPRC